MNSYSGRDTAQAPRTGETSYGEQTQASRYDIVIMM